MDLKDTQQFAVTVEGKDAKGNPAKFEAPVFTVTPPEIGTFTVDATDKAKGVFKAGAPGSGQLAFSADGIIGEGTSVVSATLDVTVLAGDVVSVQINAGAVEEQA